MNILDGCIEFLHIRNFYSNRITLCTYLSQIYNYLKYDEDFISWTFYISLQEFDSYCAHKIYGLGNQRYPWYLPIKLVIC